jgi:hypothetical protein
MRFAADGPNVFCPCDVQRTTRRQASGVAACSVGSGDLDFRFFFRAFNELSGDRRHGTLPALS